LSRVEGGKQAIGVAGCYATLEHSFPPLFLGRRNPCRHCQARQIPVVSSAMKP
jgi:hypothetical protein